MLNYQLTLIPYQGRQAEYFRAICTLLAKNANNLSLEDFDKKDWINLANIANKEGVAPMVYWLFKENHWPPTTTEPAKRILAGSFYATIAQNQVYYRDLKRILTSFDTASIPVIVLKGAALAATIYPDIGLRPMSDIDLLVQKQYLKRSIQVLEACDFYTQKTIYHVGMKNLEGVTVELHWNLLPHHDLEFGEEWIWNQAGSIANSWLLQAQVLKPEAALLYAVAHIGMQHRSEHSPLIWFYDLYLMLSKWEDQWDWKIVTEHAYRLGWDHALEEVLNIVFTLFNMDIQTASRQEIIARQPELRSKEKTENLRHRWIWNAFSSLKWKERLDLGIKLLVPTKNYILWRYQLDDVWFWPLYYPLRWWNLIKGGLEILKKNIFNGFINRRNL